MRRTGVRFIVGVLAAAASGTLGPGPASAAPNTAAAPAVRAAATGAAPVRSGAPAAWPVWLCRPGQADNPCRVPLTTTVRRTGVPDRVVRPVPLKHPPTDCFYVYPTVSEAPGPTAPLAVTPELRTIAAHQAARFGQVCRVFAPVYRQVSLRGLATATPAQREQAYRDVLTAWRAYLRSDNRGRSFVLIGHSQGAGVLRRLVAEQVDPRPRLRARMLSAILLGTSVAVRTGTVRNGDFRHVPGCTGAGQTGCVISYSTYNTTPPDNGLFGRLNPRFGSGDLVPPRYEALCTDPARLAARPGAAGPARLRTVLNTKPLYGALGAAERILFGGVPPSAATPWLVPAGQYRGGCRRSNGAHVLLVRATGGAAALNPSPTHGWGLHLVDVNIALGDLVRIVRTQSAAYRLPK